MPRLRTSMTFSWRSSRKNLISRMADMSSPSLNWPILIFLMATSRPVATSLPEGGRAPACQLGTFGSRTNRKIIPRYTVA